jgi:hypothetical protein
MDFREIRSEAVDWIHMAQDRYRCRTLVGGGGGEGGFVD